MRLRERSRNAGGGRLSQFLPQQLNYTVLRIEQKCSMIENMKGSEFLRKARAFARRNKLKYCWVPERGSGSHGTLYIGARLTIVKDLKKELGPGLLSDMCSQLGIRKEDL